MHTCLDIAHKLVTKVIVLSNEILLDRLNNKYILHSDKEYFEYLFNYTNQATGMADFEDGLRIGNQS